MDNRYIALFIDGPRHEVVVPFDSWPGLTLRFPVPMANTMFLTEAESAVWPMTATYYQWARMGNVLVYKYEGTK